MSELARFGVCLEKKLLKKFDSLIAEKNYRSRSEAIRDMVRQELVKKQWKGGKEIAGAITLIYDHHKRELLNKMTDVQHDFQRQIVSTQHIHLDHDNCLEIIAVKGKPREAQRLADTLRAVKGVKHGTLSMSSLGKEFG